MKTKRRQLLEGDIKGWRVCRKVSYSLIEGFLVDRWLVFYCCKTNHLQTKYFIILMDSMDKKLRLRKHGLSVGSMVSGASAGKIWIAEVWYHLESSSLTCPVLGRNDSSGFLPPQSLRVSPCGLSIGPLPDGGLNVVRFLTLQLRSKRECFSEQDASFMTF